MMTAFDALRGKGDRAPAVREASAATVGRGFVFDIARDFGALVRKVVLHNSDPLYQTRFRNMSTYFLVRGGLESLT